MGTRKTTRINKSTPIAGSAAKGIHVSTPFLLLGGAVLGIVVGLIICFGINYCSVLIRQVKDSYVLYKVTNERDELTATRDRLEREIALLRSEKAQNTDFEQTVKSRLDDLHAVVESTTALNLFRANRRGNNITRSPEPSIDPGPDAAIASLLNAPRTNPRSRSRQVEPQDNIDQLKAINRGLGGAEVECSREQHGKIVCSSNAADKEDISYTQDVRASLAPARLSSARENWNGDQQALLARVDLYTSLLKALPIGAPVSGELTSGYGYRVSPFSHRGSFHEGVDISLDTGTRVRAPGDGVVLRVDFDGTYGWMIDVAHTPELTTRYAHLTRALVREGQRVHRGQVIALSGSTGRSTGPHLHYEVRVNGRAKNPMPFVTLADRLAKSL